MGLQEKVWDSHEDETVLGQFLIISCGLVLAFFVPVFGFLCLGASGYFDCNNIKSNRKELTLLEAGYQEIKLKQNPDWQEPLAEIAHSSGMDAARVKAEAHKKAQARLRKPGVNAVNGGSKSK